MLEYNVYLSDEELEVVGNVVGVKFSKVDSEEAEVESLVGEKTEWYTQSFDGKQIV